MKKPPPTHTPKIGSKQKDGTVYAGAASGTKKRIYVMPVDVKVKMTFNAAVKYAAYLNKHQLFGHDDWRIPTNAEAKLLQKVQDRGRLSGTFNRGGDYWSYDTMLKDSDMTYMLNGFQWPPAPQNRKTAKCLFRLVRG